MRVTSPVAPEWFVVSSPRSCASRKQRPPAASRDADDLAVLPPASGVPTVLGGLDVDEGVVRKRRAASGFERLAQRFGEREPGSVADLEQSLPARAAAAGQPIAAVLARERDAELLEPVNRVRGLARQDVDEAAVGGLVRRAPNVLGVVLRRVVGPESGLDPTLRLRRVARLDGGLRREGDARAGALGGHCGRETRRSAPNHEHVERHRRGHGGTIPAHH
jgi:hypothetical protein